MKNKANLKLDWCSYEAAKYAVMNWHYSKAMPRSKLVKVGVWENDKFIGAILFGLGANPNLSMAWKLKNTEVCELVRVALNKHKTPVTRMIAISIKMLRKLCPGIKLIVSYADRNQGHQGIIYKAGNWQQDKVSYDEMYLFKGKKIHPKTISDRYGTRSIPWLRKNIDPTVKKIKSLGKIRYVYDLRQKH